MLEGGLTNATVHLLAHRFLNVCAGLSPLQILSWQQKDLQETGAYLCALHTETCDILKQEKKPNTRILLEEIEGGLARLTQWFNPALLDTARGTKRSISMTAAKMPAKIAAVAAVSLLIIGGVTYAVVQKKKGQTAAHQEKMLQVLSTFERSMQDLHRGHQHSVAQLTEQIANDYRHEVVTLVSLLQTLFTPTADGTVTVTLPNEEACKQLTHLATQEELATFVASLGGSADASTTLCADRTRATRQELDHHKMATQNHLIRVLARHLHNMTTADPDTVAGHNETTQTVNLIITEVLNALDAAQQRRIRTIQPLLVKFEANQSSLTLEEQMQLLASVTECYTAVSTSTPPAEPETASFRVQRTTPQPRNPLAPVTGAGCIYPPASTAHAGPFTLRSGRSGAILEHPRAPIPPHLATMLAQADAYERQIEGEAAARKQQQIQERQSACRIQRAWRKWRKNQPVMSDIFQAVLKTALGGGASRRLSLRGRSLSSGSITSISTPRAA